MAKHEEFLELLDRIVARGDDVNFLAVLAHRICNVRPFSYTQAEYDRLLKLCSRYDHVAWLAERSRMDDEMNQVDRRIPSAQPLKEPKRS
jgi:hypothetical protein